MEKKILIGFYTNIREIIMQKKNSVKEVYREKARKNLNRKIFGKLIGISIKIFCRENKFNYSNSSKRSQVD